MTMGKLPWPMRRDSDTISAPDRSMLIANPRRKL